MKKTNLCLLTVSALLTVFNACKTENPAPEKTVAAHSSSKTGAVVSALPPGNWSLVFSDEFNGTSLDLTKWSYGFGWGPFSNSFAETTEPGNSYLSNGVLVLKSEKRTVQTSEGPRDYVSGAINTRNKFSQKYGYYEARIKAAKGMGLLSAFWNKPNDESWPPEIDFMEVLGKEPYRAYFTVHYMQKSRKRSAGGVFDSPADLTADFHVYGCKWTPESVTWYVDGVQVAQNSVVTTALNSSTQPMYIMLNQHVGKPTDTWVGTPDATTPWPGIMEVDYVRCYKAL